jgi:hypothetical protein
MSGQLSPSDKHAIDMLLDHMQHESNRSAKPLAAAGLSGDRLKAAKKVLSLLDTWVLPEPSADLAASTLARVEAEGQAKIDPRAELSDSHFGQSLL